MDAKEDTRKRILAAAAQRLMRYGYTKTTMAEVAADCAMSPANLYRFFPGKVEILAAVVEGGIEEDRKILAETMAAEKGSAAQRLVAFIMAELRISFARLAASPHMVPDSRRVIENRPEVANRHLAAARAMMVEILRDGNASGEFDIADPETTAEMIQVATLKLRYPQMSSQLDLPALEREAAGVMDLILKGVLRRGRIKQRT
jgi:AcrR family transcriptional regulator